LLLKQGAAGRTENPHHAKVYGKVCGGSKSKKAAEDRKAEHFLIHLQKSMSFDITELEILPPAPWSPEV